MISVILAGGAGTRLWPKSRKFWPKFLMNLSDKESFLQKTYLRISKFTEKDKIFIVTNNEHKFFVKENINDLGFEISKENIVPEPLIKNTLPAISVVARYIYKTFGDEILCVFPSDHFIEDRENDFAGYIKSASEYAEYGKIVIFGIKPTRPEPGYGYIKLDSKLRLQGPKQCAYNISEFIEKPDIATILKISRCHKVFWNSGIFVFKISVFLEELQKYQKKIFDSVSNWDLRYESLIGIYKQIPSTSIDKGLIEKTNICCCIPVSLTWDDIGNWTALERVFKKDKKGNVIISKNTTSINCENNIIVGDKRFIATLGIKDLVVVDSEDALLIMSKKYAQDVKKIVENLGSKNELSLYHKTTPRPWGFYTVLEHKRGFKVKLIHVYPTKRLSLQKHKIRKENWFIVSGKARVVKAKRQYLLKEGDSIQIEPKVAHRLENISKNEVLELIEISRGKYLGEDDIIRLEDDFLRK